MKVKAFSTMALGLMAFAGTAMGASEITQSWKWADFAGVEEDRYVAVNNEETIQVAADTGFGWGGHAMNTGGWHNVGLRQKWWDFFIAPAANAQGTYIYTIFSTAGNGTPDMTVDNLVSFSVASHAGNQTPVRSAHVRLLIRDAAGDWHLSDNTCQLLHDGGDPETFDVTGFTWKAVDAAAQTNMNAMDSGPSVVITPGAATTPSLASITGSGLYYDSFDQPGTEYRNLQTITWTGAAPAGVDLVNADCEDPATPAKVEDFSLIPGWDRANIGGAAAIETYKDRRCLMAGQGESVFQTSAYNLQADDCFSLTAKYASSWKGKVATLSIYYLDGGNRVVLDQTSITLPTDVNTTEWDTATFTMSATVGELDANAVGKPVGVMMNTSAGYCVYDDIALAAATPVPITVTKPEVPGVDGLDINALTADVAINAGDNGFTAQYAIQIDTIDSEPTLQATSYVQANGALDASPVWQSAATWGDPVTVGPLPDLQNLTITVLVRSPGGSEDIASDASDIIIVPVELDSFEIE